MVGDCVPWWTIRRILHWENLTFHSKCRGNPINAQVARSWCPMFNHYILIMLSSVSIFGCKIRFWEVQLMFDIETCPLSFLRISTLYLPYPDAPCMEYLPTRLGHFQGKMWVHIPAPWLASGIVLHIQDYGEVTTTNLSEIVVINRLKNRGPHIISSDNDEQFAIETWPSRNSGFTHWNMMIFHSYENHPWNCFHIFQTLASIIHYELSSIVILVIYNHPDMFL